MRNTKKTILLWLRSYANAKSREGMAKFGITGNVLGGPCMPELRKKAKAIGKNHQLAGELWASGIFEARLLAIFIEEKSKVTDAQVQKWVNDFDNWAICDGACIHLFRDLRDPYRFVVLWSKRKEEFVKRAAFALLATLTVKDKKSTDAQFEKYLPLIKKNASDERNGVKKAVNWALRQIGKRNPRLRQKAITAARRIERQSTPAARWIAKDALRELIRYNKR